MTEVKRLRHRIGGMRCAVCAGHVVRALEGIGATEVAASYRSGEARCSTIAGAVQGAGYRVLGVEDVAPAATGG